MCYADPELSGKAKDEKQENDPCNQHVIDFVCRLGQDAFRLDYAVYTVLVAMFLHISNDYKVMLLFRKYVLLNIIARECATRLRARLKLVDFSSFMAGDGEHCALTREV